MPERTDFSLPELKAIVKAWMDYQELRKKMVDDCVRAAMVKKRSSSNALPENFSRMMDKIKSGKIDIIAKRLKENNLNSPLLTAKDMMKLTGMAVGMPEPTEKELDEDLREAQNDTSLLGILGKALLDTGEFSQSDTPETYAKLEKWIQAVKSLIQETGAGGIDQVVVRSSFSDEMTLKLYSQEEYRNLINASAEELDVDKTLEAQFKLMKGLFTGDTDIPEDANRQDIEAAKAMLRPKLEEAMRKAKRALAQLANLEVKRIWGRRA